MLKTILLKEIRHTGKVIFSVFLFLHILAVLLIALPPVAGALLPGRLSGIFKETPAVVSGYAELTRTDQYWGMFSTIPTFSKFDAIIEVKDRTGNKFELDPLIPGFLPVTGHLRVLVTFIRLNGTHRQYIESYLQHAADEITRSQKIIPAEITLKIFEHRLRKLDYILRDNIKDSVIVFTHGPYHCK